MERSTCRGRVGFLCFDLKVKGSNRSRGELLFFFGLNEQKYQHARICSAAVVKDSKSHLILFIVLLESSNRRAVENDIHQEY